MTTPWQSSELEQSVTPDVGSLKQPNPGVVVPASGFEPASVVPLAPPPPELVRPLVGGSQFDEQLSSTLGGWVSELEHPTVTQTRPAIQAKRRAMPKV